MIVNNLPTALIGFGMVSNGYSDDKLMNKYCKYPSHASVLRDHPNFDWQIVIDKNKKACEIAEKKWNVTYTFNTLKEAKSKLEIR